MADTTLPTPEDLRKLLDYDPETGKLTWRARGPEWFEDGAYSAQRRANRWNATYAGKAAFTHFDDEGYHRGAVLNVMLKAHRVIWALHYGEWPKAQVDHINGVRHDNRLENLRGATNQVNCRNMRRSAANTSGRTGVRRRSDNARWGAWINDQRGKKKSLGCFDTFEEACAAREAAERRYGYHKNHGRDG